MTDAKKISDIILDYALRTQAEVFGQNLLKPSYISGIGQSLVKEDGFTPLSESFFDLPNLELTTIGYGIGRAIGGHHSLCVVKQQDFLFLAMDQLINTVGNLHGDNKPRGRFTIICLVSDIPFEGTQAYANNMAIFDNCNEAIRVNYCMSIEMIKKCFADLEDEWFRLIFVSSEHMYKSSVLACKSFSDLEPGISVTEHRYEELTIVFGLVENRFLQEYEQSDKIFIYQSYKDSMFHNIIDVVNSRRYELLNLIDCSSSYNSSVYNCYYSLITANLPHIKINVRRFRSLNNDNLKLNKQREGM
jgi:hypothetical protein